jgi:hypothetical protein
MFENVQFFSHLQFKIAKSAIMGQKIFFLKNINMGIKKGRILCWFQIAGFQKCPEKKLEAKKHEKMPKNEKTQNSHSFFGSSFF